MKETQYLTLYISQEIFALEVLRIQEVIPSSYVTPIPLMQSYINGVMNVRGDIIPIINLSKRLELDAGDSTNKESIIIVSIMHENIKIVVGIVVSSVNKVFEQNIDDLESSPTFGSKIKKDFIKQIAKIDDEFIPILDLDKILDIDEISLTTEDIGDKYED